MKTTAIHSNKGGVGKTTICVNLAFHLASNGYNVCLLDNDFAGPNLFTFFPPSYNSGKYINQYIEGKIDPQDFLVDVSAHYNLKGKLMVGLADPNPDATRAALKLDSQAATNMLRRQLKLKSDLAKKEYGVEFLILDTTPGIGMTTINSFLLADSILFLIKMSNADIIGTGMMIKGLLDSLYNRTMIVANQIPPERIGEDSQRRNLESLILKTFKESSGVDGIEFLGWIPSDPDLQLIEFDNVVKELEGKDSKRTIYTLDNPDHPISRSLKDISDQMFF